MLPSCKRPSRSLIYCLSVDSIVCAKLPWAGSQHIGDGWCSSRILFRSAPKLHSRNFLISCNSTMGSKASTRSAWSAVMSKAKRNRTYLVEGCLF